MATNITFHPGSVDIAERVNLLGQTGITIWLTGLSGSGKVIFVVTILTGVHSDQVMDRIQSTIACGLEQYLLHLKRFAYRLDGDNIRFGLNQDLAFDEQSRVENIRRIGEVSKLFADSACISITAFISPYRADRELVRQMHERAHLAFIEVFVDAPLHVAEERDPKGLYKKARAGKIKDFTGISAPYEAPEQPDIHLETHKYGVDECIQIIAEHLRTRGFIG